MSPTRAPHAHEPDSPSPGLTDEQARQIALLPSIAATLGEIREAIRGRIKEYYSVDEFAALAGRAPHTVRAWISGGRIDAIRIEGSGPRGRLLVPRAEVEKLVIQGRGGAIPDAALPSGPAASPRLTANSKDPNRRNDDEFIYEHTSEMN